MKSLLLPLIAVLALPTAVNANVDPEVHKLCLPAADYLGCIKAMTTKSTDIPSMRMIDGGVELSGNKCPEGMLYFGGGICREIGCLLRGRPHSWKDIAIESAGYRCGWSVGYHYQIAARAVIDNNCPNKEPYLFTSSSCDERLNPPPRKRIRAYPTYKSNRPIWDKKLEQVYGIPNLYSDAFSKPKKVINSDTSNGSVKINCDSPVWKNKPRCN